MKQKVLISAALLHDPDLLILDEPESGLDVTAVLVLRSLITELARRGKAILYSSHIMESVERVCSRVMVLHRGEVVADDSASRLRTLMSRDSLEAVFAQAGRARQSRPHRVGHRRRGRAARLNEAAPETSDHVAPPRSHSV